MRWLSILSVVLFVVSPCVAQEIASELTPTRVFTLDTAGEFVEYPGGFAGAPAGRVVVGRIPSDATGLSDGVGATITVAPGGVELLLFPTLEVGTNVALIRASVQSTGGGEGFLT
jgi:hypothetical protein